MMSQLQIIATWGTLLPFGVIALAGQGLHLLPGMGHRCGDNHADQACCHARGHHEPLEPPANPDGQVTALPSLADGHDCPICRFFATTKPLLATVTEAELSQVVSPIRSLDAPARPIYRAAVYRSRAPPLG